MVFIVRIEFIIGKCVAFELFVFFFLRYSSLNFTESNIVIS